MKLLSSDDISHNLCLLTENQINAGSQFLWSSYLGQIFWWTVCVWLYERMLMHIWAHKSTFFKQN